MRPLLACPQSDRTSKKPPEMAAFSILNQSICRAFVKLLPGVGQRSPIGLNRTPGLRNQPNAHSDPEGGQEDAGLYDKVLLE